MGSDLGERLEIKDKCKKKSRYLGLKIVFDIKKDCFDEPAGRGCKQRSEI